MATAPRKNEPKIEADDVLEGIVEWVSIESPSHDGKSVNKVVDHVEGQFRDLGLKLDRTPGVDGFGDILECKTTPEMSQQADGKGILVLAHLDTVHPIGMIEKDLKVRREGDSIFGPGIYDMKAGGYIAYYALRHLIRQGKKTKLPVTFLFIPEEEVGSPTSRARIEEAARGHKYALVMEPGRDGDRVVTSRKGVGRFTLKVKGAASHAGVRHQDGRSAIHEMARQIMRIEAKTDYERGITCNVGLISGGTGVNVVPAECTVEVDLRVPTMQLAEEMTHWFLGLEPIGKDVELTVDRRDEPPALPEGRRHHVAVREGAGDLSRDRQGAERRAADRRRQRRQLHRRARHPDARRPRRRRQGRARRLRADLLFVAGAAHLSLRAAAGDARLMATLYHVPTSRSLRVLWTLEEIGATVEVKSLGVRPRLQEPEYLAINPAGTLPALIDGERAIYESLAICEYLAARHGSDLVVAPDEPERPEFVQWLLYGEATCRRRSRRWRVSAVSGTRRRRCRPASMPCCPTRATRSRCGSKLLEQRLEGRDFLVAGRMTLADISVGYPLNTMGKPDFASLLGPRATAYRERLSTMRRTRARCACSGRSRSSA